MQISDTAYPRLKSSFNAGELERWYTPTQDERELCAQYVRGEKNRFGFLLMLKTFQRLGYFITSVDMPDAIIGHIVQTELQAEHRKMLALYDISRTRKLHRRNYSSVSERYPLQS